MDLYPLLLEPSLHVKVWGGRKLANMMHKALPTDEPYGESWEVHDSAKVANGSLAGRTLGELLAESGADLIGPNNDPKLGFPLLAKILDSSDWLSVQVHPNDDQAQKLEDDPRGKTEAWYVLAAEPGAQLVIGVKPGTTREIMAECIRRNALQDVLVYTNVTAGDALLLRANTVHALGPGVLLYEIQQSSDVTYRLFDWGRVGLDGKPRDLHIDKAITVSNTESLPTIHHLRSSSGTSSLQSSAREIEVVRCEYFATSLHQIRDTTITLDTAGRRFHALTCISGEIDVESGQGITLTAGQSALIPACVGAYTLSGSGNVLRSFQTNQ